MVEKKGKRFVVTVGKLTAKRYSHREDTETHKFIPFIEFCCKKAEEAWGIGMITHNERYTKVVLNNESSDYDGWPSGGEIQIKVCPFCGTKIEIVKDDENYVTAGCVLNDWALDDYTIKENTFMDAPTIRREFFFALQPSMSFPVEEVNERDEM